MESIDLLISKDEVYQVLNAVFIATDEKDWLKVQNCFDSKVLFDMTSLSGGEPVTLTPDQITAAWDEGLEAPNSVHHQIGNYVIRIPEPGLSKASCYGIALHYYDDPKHLHSFVGTYDFELVNGGGSWKISKFKFNCKYTAKSPLE